MQRLGATAKRLAPLSQLTGGRRPLEPEGPLRVSGQDLLPSTKKGHSSAIRVQLSELSACSGGVPAASESILRHDLAIAVDLQGKPSLPVGQEVFRLPFEGSSFVRVEPHDCRSDRFPGHD